MDGEAIVKWVRSVHHFAWLDCWPVLTHQPLLISLCSSVYTQVLQCQHPSGGFGGSERHDSHLLYTLSAVQILALYNKLHLIDADQVASCKYRHAHHLNLLSSLCHSNFCFLPQSDLSMHASRCAELATT